MGCVNPLGTLSTENPLEGRIDHFIGQAVPIHILRPKHHTHRFIFLGLHAPGLGARGIVLGGEGQSDRGNGGTGLTIADFVGEDIFPMGMLIRGVNQIGRCPAQSPQEGLSQDRVSERVTIGVFTEQGQGGRLIFLEGHRKGGGCWRVVEGRDGDLDGGKLTGGHTIGDPIGELITASIVGRWQILNLWRRTGKLSRGWTLHDLVG